MNWINNLEKRIKESLKVSKATLPDSSILEKAGCSKKRFYTLLNNSAKMNAWEAMVFSAWLGTDPRDMVSIVASKKKSVNTKSELQHG